VPIWAYVNPCVASSAWMCMYCAMARALAPVSIFWSATLFVGHSVIEETMPAFCASALIADGVMSEDPTMYSLLRLLLTVCRPLMPIVTATAPNTMSTTAATIPPSLKYLRLSRMTRLLSEHWRCFWLIVGWGCACYLG